MSNYMQSFDRNKFAKFYSTSGVGSEGYNPEIVMYYGSDDNVVRIEERWRGETWVRTISGSNYAQNWPEYDRSEILSSWEMVTIS